MGERARAHTHVCSLARQKRKQRNARSHTHYKILIDLHSWHNPAKNPNTPYSHEVNMPAQGSRGLLDPAPLPHSMLHPKISTFNNHCLFNHKT